MKRFSRTTLAISLLTCTTFAYAADAKNATASANISDAERAKIEQVVHEYLLRKPEILVEALQKLQQKQYEQAEQTVKKTQSMAASFANPLFHQANDPFSGNPNGKVTIVEFFDYQCPHCVEMVPTIDAILKDNPDVRVVYKEFPIRGPISELAARAALAANLQGKYNVFSHALFATKSPLTQDIIYSLATANGLDVDKLKKDMTSPAIDSQIKNTLKLAQDLKLFGTPALFIGKTDTKGTDTIAYVPGQVDIKQLQTMIDKAK